EATGEYRVEHLHREAAHERDDASGHVENDQDEQDEQPHAHRRREQAPAFAPPARSAAGTDGARLSHGDRPRRRLRRVTSLPSPCAFPPLWPPHRTNGNLSISRPTAIESLGGLDFTGLLPYY